MAKRHLRLREPGWRHGLLINGLGADHDGRGDRRDRDHEVRRRRVGRDAVRPRDGLGPGSDEPPVRARARRARRRASPVRARTGRRRPAALVVVEDLDRKTMHALQYAKTIRSSSAYAVHVDATDRASPSSSRGAGPSSGSACRSAILPADRRPDDDDRRLRGATRGRRRRDRHRPRTRADGSSSNASGEGARGLDSHARWLPNPHVRVTLVRDHPDHSRGLAPDGRAASLAASHRAVVLVDRPDRAAMQAVRYALSLGASEVVAVHAAVDPDVQDELISRWMDLRVPDRRWTWWSAGTATLRGRSNGTSSTSWDPHRGHRRAPTARLRPGHPAAPPRPDEPQHRPGARPVRARGRGGRPLLLRQVAARPTPRGDAGGRRAPAAADQAR